VSKSDKQRLVLRFLILGMFLSCLILFSTGAARTLFPSTKDGRRNHTVRSTTQQPEKDDRPIVDYDSGSVTPELDPRKAKGARHDKQFAVRDIDTGGRPVLAFSHWDAGLPALPVVRSTLVVLGQVADAKAYLSNDKSGVYSEFRISVERVIKNDISSPAFPGQLVTAERWGGRVRFPSGRVLIFGNRGQGVPRAGERYVFFLEGDAQQYSILTAYGLASARVHPLDGRTALGGEHSEWPGNAYEGANAEGFLNELQTTVARSLAASP
jgi:hypothetical protein